MKGHREAQTIRGAGPRLRLVRRGVQGPGPSRPWSALWPPLLGLGLVLAPGCSDSEAPDDAEPELIDPSTVPTPPADGPPLWGAKTGAPVLDRPSADGTVLGTLAFGGRVARSEEPVTTHGCEGGWYAIHPRGFVCAGEGATIDPEAPAATMVVAADRNKNLPLRYAYVHGKGAVTYGQLPDAEKESLNEWKLDKKKERQEELLGPSANDVPIGDDAFPSGPAVVKPGADGVNAAGYRTNVAWFELPTQGEAQPGFQLTPQEDDLVILKPKTRVGIMGTVQSNDRTFAILSNGRFVGTDQLSPEIGVVWHGYDARERGLSIGFTLRRGVHPYTIEDRVPKAIEDIELEPHEPIPVTGRYRTIHKQRYYMNYDKQWMRHRDLIMILDRGQLPDFATGKQKWIDISLANQTLTAFEGKKVIMVTLISSGRDRLGNPDEGPSTKQGVFHIRRKAVRENLDDREAHMKFSISDAPWFMEFEEGFALVGAYWLNRFGESRLYHHVGLSPIDAKFLFEWTKGEVPTGWNSVAMGEEEGTIVYVHK